MRRKVVLPHRTAGKTEDRPQHGLHIFRIKEQEHGGRWIADIDGPRTPVGIIFFGKEDEISLLVRDQLMGCHDLAVGDAA